MSAYEKSSVNQSAAGIRIRPKNANEKKMVSKARPKA